MDLSQYEVEREELVERTAETMLDEYLLDISKFEELESGYEFLTANAHNLQRALRNLDDAIKGKEYAQDAVYTALSYIQTNLKKFCEDRADEDTPGAYDLYESAHADALDARMDAAKDARLGL